MNSAVLAGATKISPASSVVAVVFDPGPAYHVVLRCFRCDWGYTVRTWADALHTGIEHEAEHAHEAVSA